MSTMGNGQETGQPNAEVQQDSPMTEPSDSGSEESPREALPSRETDTTESPFVSPSNTDSPREQFRVSGFQLG